MGCRESKKRTVGAAIWKFRSKSRNERVGRGGEEK